MHRPATPIFLLLAAFVLMGLARAALARTGPAPVERGVEIRVGWGNTYRAGRWNPIYMTAQSNPPREVIAQVEGMHSAPHAMSVRSRFALSPGLSTHTVYFPLPEGSALGQTTLILRDADTGKRVGASSFSLTPPVQQAPLGEPMIGVSGDFSTFGLLKDQFAGDAAVGYEAPPYLPVVAAGYDALDLLVLNAPDLSKIHDDQQNAIVAWLRAGGTLVIWPGATATPVASPLVKWLPAVIGENQLIELDPAVVARAGLTRIAGIRARQLAPLPDAESVPLLGPQVTAFRRSVGFGQILIAPIDLATLRFQSGDAVRKFWSPVLSGVPDRTRDNQPDATVTRWLRDAHVSRVRLVPAWLIVAFFIVGPLDTLLLKLLGRWPWLVVTVIGWAGLIAAITMNVRERSRERSVDYRTVRIIDEVDGAAATTTDYVAVRWPQGATFAFADERGAWWKPANDPTDPPGSPRSEFHAEQHAGGTWPARLAAHVPTPRVLHVQRWISDPSQVVADLSLRDGRIVGKLTNGGEHPLINVRIRAAGGVARLNVPRIESGATIDVDAEVDPGDRSLDIPAAESFYSARRATDAPILLPDYSAIEASTLGRATRIMNLLAAGGRACVYAEVQDPSPPAELSAPVNQNHLAFVRSVVRLQ